MKRHVRKLMTGIFSIIMVISLAGCGSTFPEMTDEQEKQIGEYAAMTLLKYDASNRSRLVDAAEIEEHDRKEQEKKEQAAQATPEPTPEGMQPVEDTPTIEVGGEVLEQEPEMSIEESLAAPEGVSVQYQDYTICDTYPENGSDDYLALDASQGKKLLVLNFMVSNQTSEKKEVDFFSKDSVYRVKVGDAELQSAMTTLLLDDLSTYIGELEANESKNLVLVFEVEDNIEGNDIKLYFKNESKEYSIQLNN